MGQKSGPVKEPAEQVVKEIRRATRRQFSAEEKIRIVLSGLRGEDSIAELCRREGIVQNLYYRWSKDFLEARSNDWDRRRRLGRCGVGLLSEMLPAKNAPRGNHYCHDTGERRSAASAVCGPDVGSGR
jgi:transposase-like protein